jgi:D-glycero-D-manno-heptose 1,7-bisphosphate phosphatase
MRVVHGAADQPAVFLDRDGVLNHLVVDPTSGLAESPLRMADVAIVAGAGAGIYRLRAAGWLVVCVTNQPAVAKGSVELSTLLEIHERVRLLLASEGGHFDGERICLHHPNGIVAGFTGVCKCRKPEPGMLLDSAAEYGIDLNRSWMIGDTDADVNAGRAAGARTVLVKADGSEHKRSGDVESDLVVADISEAVDAILANEP